MRTIFLAALLLFAAAPARSQTAAVGTVTQLQSTASVTRQGATRPLQSGDQVFDDDILETGPEAKLLVDFIDGSKLTLGPSADVVIDEFVYNPAGGANSAALTVAAGAMRLVAGAVERIGGAQAVKVATPVGSVGIRGTDFFVELEADHLAVALFSGFEIVVTNPAGNTVLRPGEGTDIWGPTAPSQALSWGYDRVNRALALVTLTADSNQRPLPYAQPIAAAPTPVEALTAGTFKFDARYRYEFVDRAALTNTAHASTLRLRAGFESLAINGFYAGLEGEITREIGNNRRNDGVVNPLALPFPLPVIADPESEVLNRAYVGWTMAGEDGLAGARVVVGRQRISYDNERWVGPVNFRQNDQTFDAATVEARPVEGLALRYAYVDRVNRILGNNIGGHWGSSSHLVAAATNRIPFGVTTAYAYVLDLKPVPRLSSATYGVRYEAVPEVSSGLTFGVEAEIARQTDQGANPTSFALTYALLRPAVRWNDMTTLSIGWEHLGGNGVAAVQSPLATLHRHNGWADVFTTTPVNGLRDVHLRVMQELPDVGFLSNPRIDFRYHDFRATRGGSHYGTEWDVDVNFSVLSRATLGLRYAAYNAKRFDSDTEKLWLYLEFQY